MLAEPVEGIHNAHVCIRASTAHASVLMVRQNESTICARCPHIRGQLSNMPLTTVSYDTVHAAHGKWFQAEACILRHNRLLARLLHAASMCDIGTQRDEVMEARLGSHARREAN